jgi:sugar O-acyltransferase (sialic acid O-acetyltransferase NeuD family)
LKNIVLIGYSGHAYVVFESFFSQGQIVIGYTDIEEKQKNPYSLKWLGSETQQEVIEALKKYDYFVSLGDNLLRKKVSKNLISQLGQPQNTIHKSATISRTMDCGIGNMFAAGCVINPLVKIGNGVICNTGCIIEHECIINDYSHIAPGAVLCGNVTVGEGSFVGAGAVIKQGVKIGQDVIIGAGAVIYKNVLDNTKVVGNNHRML